MTTQFSDGRPQILTGLGQCLPVWISIDSQQSSLPPGVFVNTSSDSDLTGVMEISPDRFDATGNLPSPGFWLPFVDFGGPSYAAENIVGRLTSARGAIGGYCKIPLVITAIRLRLTSYVAGSVTFAVTQSRIPALHGGL